MKFSVSRIGIQFLFELSRTLQRRRPVAEAVGKQYIENKMKISKVTDSDKKSEICEKILRSLPLWFGIESAIVDYTNDVRRMPMWTMYNDEIERIIAFISINKHFPQTAEIHVMGVLENYHRRGIARALLTQIEKELRKEGIQFLTVKTLSESRPNKEYDQTRNFYLNMGFTPLEEFKTLWGEHNPCLFLAKTL